MSSHNGPETKETVETKETKETVELRAKLSSLEEKYEALEKRFNAVFSATLLQKVVTEDKETTTEPTTKAAEQKKTRKTAVKGGSSLPTASAHLEPNKMSEETSNSRARILISRMNKTGERTESPAQKLSDTKADSGKHAFTLCKFVFNRTAERPANSSIIHFHDRNLWDLLKSELSYYPYHSFQGPPAIIRSPFEPLVHNWDHLQKLATAEVSDENGSQARNDLKLLMDTILGGSGDEDLDSYFKLRETTRRQGSVTYKDLWTLFPPGTLVYGNPFQGQPEVFLVQDHNGVWPTGNRENWSIACWAYDWNSTKFCRSSYNIEFEQFEGQKSIASLPYYPLCFHKEEKELRSELITRGKRFRTLCESREGSQMFAYEGGAIFGLKGFSMQTIKTTDDDTRYRSAPGLGEPRSRSSLPPRMLANRIETRLKTSQVDGHVMVDFASYFSYGPSQGAQIGNLLPSKSILECTCDKCKQNIALAEIYRTRFDEGEHQTDEWHDEQYILCPPRVLGYVLQEKQWAQLRVDCVRGIPRSDPSDAWYSRLQLADEGGARGRRSDTKELLLNLVKSHVTSNTTKNSELEVDDIIAGKGKGLVILLYGPPGVGKTSTAETLALATRKPLFSISVADVGTNAEYAEANFRKIFDLASLWQAILLIDEADVFLESRQRGAGSSVERNALVSVLLRVLEYYQGILILTTNQIAQFDVAVLSRIHIAIEYTSLNRDQQERIFNTFLDPLDKAGLIESYEDITDWLEESVYSSHNLDGRQIRNIITSALGLARANGDNKLKKAHLQPIFKNTNMFKQAYIREFEKYKTAQNSMIK